MPRPVPRRSIEHDGSESRVNRLRNRLLEESLALTLRAPLPGVYCVDSIPLSECCGGAPAYHTHTVLSEYSVYLCGPTEWTSFAKYCPALNIVPLELQQLA